MKEEIIETFHLGICGEGDRKGEVLHEQPPSGRHDVDVVELDAVRGEHARRVLRRRNLQLFLQKQRREPDENHSSPP